MIERGSVHAYLHNSSLNKGFKKCFATPSKPKCFISVVKWPTRMDQREVHAIVAPLVLFSFLHFWFLFSAKFLFEVASASFFFLDDFCLMMGICQVQNTLHHKGCMPLLVAWYLVLGVCAITSSGIMNFGT